MSLFQSLQWLRFRRLPQYLLTTLAILSGLAVAQNNPDDYSERFSVTTATTSPYYRATVPLSAYLSSARGDLRDVRVFNADGQPVPHARLIANGSTEEQVRRRALRWFPLRAATSGSGSAESNNALKVVVRQAGDGTLVEVDSNHGASALRPEAAETAVRGYVLDASKIADRRSTRALEIDWSEADGDFQLVDVASSDDLRHWTPLASGVQLARLDFDGRRIENRRIALPGFDDRYLRLTWRQPAEAPALTGVEIEQSRTRYRSPPLAWSMLVVGSAGEGLKAGEYRFRLDRPLPLARLRIELPPGNQLLPVEVLAPRHERHYWRHLTSGVAYRIANKGREWSNTEIPLSGRPLQEFVLRIDPRLNPPEPLKVSYAVQPAEIVFLASGEAPYSLAVGNAEAHDMALPINTLIPGFGQPGSPEIADARIDVTGRPMPPATAPTATPSGHGWKKIALWSVLLLGVAGMAAMAWQLLRQMKQTDGQG